MKKSTQSLLLGLVFGLTVLAAGQIVSAQLSRKVEALISECSVQHQKPTPVDAPAWAKDPLVCQPQDLQFSAGSSSNKLVGIQASILETHSASVAWLERSRFVGILVFGLLALPYCWHFLLRRIAELRQAFIGR